MTARRIAVGIVAICFASVAAGTVYFVLNRAGGGRGSSFSYSDLIQNLGPALVFLATGAVIAIRKAENRIGWLMLALALYGSITWAATQYAAYGLVVHSGSTPGGKAIAVATTNSGFAPEIVLLLLIVVLFPDGRLLSRRWRIVPAAAFVAFAGLWLVGSTQKLGAPFEHVANPLGSWPIVPLVVVFIPLAIGSVVGAFAAITVRFRRSRGDEREQLKWLVFAASVLPVGLVAHTLAEVVAPSAIGTIEFLFTLGVLAIPVAIGVAILKYRLYDIDRIISRTLGYSALTVVLGGAYVGLVLLGQAVFDSFDSGSNLAIALSTLVVAALFLPVRARIQRIVDRHFHRSRYDAQRTLERFALRVRDEVELQTVESQLRDVVGETMRPAFVTLWLAARNASVTTAP